MSGRARYGSGGSNIQQLTLFRNYWRDSPEYPRENFGNDRVVYPVYVEYEWANGNANARFETEFVAYVGAGPNDGEINLEETEAVLINEFHLTFKPEFQRYIFDEETGALIVRGSSEKMSGRYSVRISPRLAPPSVV